MSRRCKLGDRARIITGGDKGKVVAVLRKYHGELIDGGTWEEGFYPWVVVSLSGLLGCRCTKTNADLPPVMTAVYDDAELEPIRDDDPDEGESIEKDRPRELERSP